MVEAVSSLIGFELREHDWIAFCPNYGISATGRDMDSAWNRVVDLSNEWVEWCLFYGLPELSDEYLSYIDHLEKSKQKQSTIVKYASVEIADLSIEMTGWLLLDSLPSQWGLSR